MPASTDSVVDGDLKTYRPPNNEEPQIRLEDVINRIRVGLPNMGGRSIGGGLTAIVIVIVIIAFVIWLATGIYTVGPTEQAANQLFGEYIEPPANSGLHWWWPGPIGTRNVVGVTETRRLELGFRSSEGGPVIGVPGEALMITGDLNIADVQLAIQYRVQDIEAFLFQVDDPGDPERAVPAGSPEGLTLKDATEAALRQVVGQRSIDDVLTINKEAAQDDTLLLLQQILNDYETGIEILQVRLQDVRPPAEVRDAFDDVVRARVDKEARINEANAYQQDQLPRARGLAQQITNAATAFKQERQEKATGEADRFLAVLEEYELSPEVTRRRLYLEAMEEILPGITKFILTEETAGGVLPFLPLGPGAITGGAAAAGATGGGQ